MNRGSNRADPGQLQAKYGFGVVVIGLALVAFIFGVALLKWSNASDVSTVVSSATGVIGTLVGAFFGVQVGSAGKEKADAARKEAEDKALQFAAALQPTEATKILDKLAGLNKSE